MGPNALSGSQFSAQSMSPSASGVVGAATVGSQNMSVPTLQQPGSILPGKDTMSQSNWNLANNAIGAMKTSGRDDSFIQSHLGTEMAMMSRNWGLNDAQGAKAGAMINSGRTGQQVASALSTPSPSSSLSTPQFKPTMSSTPSAPKPSTGMSFNTFMNKGFNSGGQAVNLNKAF